MAKVNANAGVQAAFVANRAIERIVDAKHNDIYYLKPQRLGKGGFGTCFEAVLRGTPVALKLIFTGHTHDRQARKQKTLAMHEVNVLRSLDHRSIVAFNRNFCVDSLAIISMELCTRGSIEGLLQKRWEQETGRSRSTLRKDETGRAKAQKHEVATWMSQVAQALVYLHEKMGLVHRDLKPNNVLLDGQGMVKIAGFGLSLYENGEAQSGSCGTEGYQAPEMWWEGYHHGRPLDIFAFGAMVHCLILGEPPELKNVPLVKYENSLEPWQDLLWGTLHPVPSERMLAREVMDHSFFGRSTGTKRPLEQDSCVVEEPVKRAKEANAHTDEGSSTTPTGASPEHSCFPNVPSPAHPCPCIRSAVLAPPASSPAMEENEEKEEKLEQPGCGDSSSSLPSPFNNMSSLSSSSLGSLPSASSPAKQKNLATMFPDITSAEKKLSLDTSAEGSSEEAAILPPVQDAPINNDDFVFERLPSPLWLVTSEIPSGDLLGDLPLPFDKDL